MDTDVYIEKSESKDPNPPSAANTDTDANAPAEDTTTGQDVTKKKNQFAHVVATTMLIKNWLTSVHRDRRHDHEFFDEAASIMNTSLVFEPQGSRQGSQQGSTRDLERGDIELQVLNDEHELPNLHEEAQEGQTTTPPTQQLSFFMKNLKRLKNCHHEVINPTKSFYYYWCFVVYFAFLYNAFMCVVFVFEGTDGMFYTSWLIGNVITDILYTLDIFMHCRLSFMKDGKYVQDVRYLVHRYFNSWDFLLDFLCLIPLDFGLLIYPEMSIVRINRLCKAYRVFDFIEKQNLRTNFPNGFRIFHIVIICLILFHWNASAYFKISLWTGINSTEFNAWEFNYVKIADPILAKCNTWQAASEPSNQTDCDYKGVYPSSQEEVNAIENMMNYWEPKSVKIIVSNFTKQYMLSMYWSSLTLTTSGQQPYPTASSHNFLEIFDSIIGMLIFSVIVGSVGNVVATMNKNQTEFQNLMDGLKFYMNYRDVKPLVQKRILDSVSYMEKYGMVMDENSVLSTMPPRLRGQVAVYLHMENLKRVRLLRDCEPSLLYELVLRLEMQMFSPNDIICKVNDLAREMFIVKRGVLEMRAPNGKVVNQIKEGASFGELALLKIGGHKLNRRTRTLISIGYSDVYVLRREKVLAVLQDYPEQRTKLVEKAKQMICQQHDALQDEFDNADALIEDLKESSELQTTDETLQSISQSITAMDKEITSILTAYQNNNSIMKKRMYGLERSYVKNRRRINDVNSRRLIEELGRINASDNEQHPKIEKDEKPSS